MGRSQRHLILEQGAPSNGEAIAEGQPAPAFVAQASEVEVVYETGGPLAGSTTVDVSTLEVTYGPEGGPLAGSSISSAVPGEGGGGEPEPEPGDFRILGFSPDDVPAGYPDLSVDVLGQGFEDGAIIVWGGEDQVTEFVSETRLRFLCNVSGAVVGDVAVTVRNPGGETTEEATYTFTEPAADEPASRSKRKR